MLTMIYNVVNTISGFLYDPWVPLFLVVAGVLLTFRTKFVQLRLVKESIHVVMEKPATEGSVSSFGALMISTASRVGTGNIVGVSTAICLGGVGAVFWMWFIAIFGGASAFVESTLAQIYKKKRADGSSSGYRSGASLTICSSSFSASRRLLAESSARATHRERVILCSC